MLYRNVLHLTVAVIVTVGMAASAEAQGQRGGGQGGFGRGGFGGGGFGGGFSDPFSLVNNPAIRTELGIDESQVEKLRELRQQLDAEVDAARQKVTAQYTEKLSDVLLPHQADRLLGISIQLRGAAALQDPAVAKRIGLTDAQQKELTTKLEALSERNRGAFRGGQDGERPDREALQARLQEQRQERDNIINSVLTSDQKKKLDELKGEEIDRAQLFQRQGGQGGRGGRGGNN